MRTVKFGLVAAMLVHVFINLSAVLLIVAVLTGSESLVPSSPLLRVIIGAWLGLGLVLGLIALSGGRRITFNRRSLRRPTKDERELLAPAWLAVAHRAGVRADAYELAISGAESWVSFGRIIAVPVQAVQSLPRPQLDAVMAHELGHTMGANGPVAAMASWYAVLPGVGALWLGSFLFRAARWLFSFVYRSSRVVFAFFLPRPIPMLSGIYFAVSCVACPAVIIAPYLVVWLVPVAVVTMILMWLFRVGDKCADAVAADLGYGSVMLELLSRMAWDSPEEQVGRWDRLGDGTLPASVRLEVLGRYMASRGL